MTWAEVYTLIMGIAQWATLGLLFWAVWVLSDAVKQLQLIELKRSKSSAEPK